MGSRSAAGRAEEEEYASVTSGPVSAACGLRIDVRHGWRHRSDGSAAHCQGARGRGQPGGQRAGGAVHRRAARRAAGNGQRVPGASRQDAVPEARADTGRWLVQPDVDAQRRRSAGGLRCRASPLRGRRAKEDHRAADRGRHPCAPDGRCRNRQSTRRARVPTRPTHGRAEKGGQAGPSVDDHGARIYGDGGAERDVLHYGHGDQRLRRCPVQHLRRGGRP